MTDLSHLNALQVRLSHERGYLAQAKTECESKLRNVWIVQIEKEIEMERKFLGIAAEPACDMSDDELLAELSQ